MKKLTFLLTLVLLLTAVYAEGTDTAKEKEAIKKVIQNSYVDGLISEGDLSKVEAGFHGCFVLLGPGRGNDTWQLPIYNWVERMKEQKAAGKLPLPEDKKVTIKFDWVDVEGTTAVAKFKFYEGGKLSYTDYLSLYKFKNGWKIVHKIYATHK